MRLRYSFRSRTRDRAGLEARAAAQHLHVPTVKSRVRGTRRRHGLGGVEQLCSDHSVEDVHFDAGCDIAPSQEAAGHLGVRGTRKIDARFHSFIVLAVVGEDSAKVSERRTV
jgi:hypothetical protein